MRVPAEPVAPVRDRQGPSVTVTSRTVRVAVTTDGSTTRPASLCVRCVSPWTPPLRWWPVVQQPMWCLTFTVTVDQLVRYLALVYCSFVLCLKGRMRLYNILSLLIIIVIYCNFYETIWYCILVKFILLISTYKYGWLYLTRNDIKRYRNFIKCDGNRDYCTLFLMFKEGKRCIDKPWSDIHRNVWFVSGQKEHWRTEECNNLCGSGWTVVRRAWIPSILLLHSTSSSWIHSKIF